MRILDRIISFYNTVSMKIYFSGIGGAGLTPLALLSQDCGYEVLGSDRESSLNTHELSNRKIPFVLEQTGGYLANQHVAQPVDLFVYTSALKDDHPELVAAKELGIPTVKRAELLNIILKDKNLKLLAVAGTHGKTTTSAMCVWLFKQLNLPVSYSIGSNISFGPAAQYEKGSKWFVYECDEFDRNFLEFHPNISIITSLDYDHPDTYPTEKAYNEAFLEFINQSREAVYMWSADWQKITNKDQSAYSHVHTFNSQKMLDVHSRYKPYLTGEHNRKNGFLAINAVNLGTNLDPITLKSALEKFPGTQRRFEKLSSGVYSDYAHHPAEIAATLQMAKELNQEVVIVYQPHQNLRQHEVKDEYTHCFDGAKQVYWLPTYLSREPEGIEILEPEELGSYVINTPVVYAHMNDELRGELENHKSEGSLVVFMGAGSIDAWARDNFLPQVV